MEYKEIAVLDIETTALKPSEGSIVEIGICLLNTTNGETAKLFNHIVSEGRMTLKESNAWIFDNSTLLPLEVSSAKPLGFYRKWLQTILLEYPTIAYNRRFDFGFLENRGFEIKKADMQDPMHVCTPILKIPRGRGYKYPKVEEAYRYFFGDSYTEEHRAYADCVDEAKIVYELIQRGHYGS